MLNILLTLTQPNALAAVVHPLPPFHSLHLPAAPFAIAATMIASLATMTLTAAWAIGERLRYLTQRRIAQVSRKKQASSIDLRDDLLLLGWDGVYIVSENGDPFDLGRGGELLRDCFSGPDAAALSKHTDALAAGRMAFECVARTRQGLGVEFRGRTLEKRCVIFARYRDAWGTTEADHAARGDAYAGLVDQLSTAVAAFDCHRRLVAANRALIERFGLSEQWLEKRPLLDDILDDLHAAGRLPEQRDYLAWRGQVVAMFDRPNTGVRQVWHQPNGRSERVSIRPLPNGALAFLFDDITAELEQRRAYNVLVKVEQAIIEKLPEPAAVFGLDGRLKLFNREFLRLWRLEGDASVLEDAHISDLTKLCAARIGGEECWEFVRSGVNGDGPAKETEWGGARRVDGRMISVATTRLPDAATLVTFADVTEYINVRALLPAETHAA